MYVIHFILLLAAQKYAKSKYMSFKGRLREIPTDCILRIERNICLSVYRFAEMRNLSYIFHILFDITFGVDSLHQLLHFEIYS